MPRKRNLYLIKTTLEKFGTVQLPSNLDVLRRVLYLHEIDGLIHAMACADTTVELYNLCQLKGIPTPEKPEMNTRVVKLFKIYQDVRKRFERITTYTAEQLEKKRDEVIEFFDREKPFCSRLNRSFPAYWSNVEELLIKMGRTEKQMEDFRDEIRDRDYRLVDYDLSTPSDVLFEHLREKKAAVAVASRISLH